MCSVCKKVFPIEKLKQMQVLVGYLSNKGCLTDVALIKKLSDGLEPVYYYKLSETETKIEETVLDKVVMPSHTFITDQFTVSITMINGTSPQNPET